MMRLIAAMVSGALIAGCVPSPEPGNDAARKAAQGAMQNSETEIVQAVEGSATSSVSKAEPEPAGPTTFVFDGALTQGGWIKGQAPAGTRTARLGEQELILTEEGRFFAAFGRDAENTVILSATRADGSTLESPVTISPRDWKISRLNIARRPGGSSAAFRARRQPELDRIWDARQQRSETDGWTQKFVWPVKGRISDPFGSQRYYRGEPGSFHSGIDIAPGTGVPFVAPADGVVVLADRNFSLEGQLIIIDHGQGLNSAFLHASRILVNEGDIVQQGQHIGDVGASGNVTGPHLHWSVKWHNARLDPILLTGPMD